MNTTQDATERQNREAGNQTAEIRVSEEVKGAEYQLVIKGVRVDFDSVSNEYGYTALKKDEEEVAKIQNAEVSSEIRQVVRR